MEVRMEIIILLFILAIYGLVALNKKNQNRLLAKVKNGGFDLEEQDAIKLKIRLINNETHIYTINKRAVNWYQSGKCLVIQCDYCFRVDENGYKILTDYPEYRNMGIIGLPGYGITSERFREKEYSYASIISIEAIAQDHKASNKFKDISELLRFEIDFSGKP